MSISSFKNSLFTVSLSASMALFVSACSTMDRSSNTLENVDKANTYNYLNAPSKKSAQVPVVTAQKFTPTSKLQSARLSNKELVDLFAGQTAYGKLNDKNGEWVEFTSDSGRAIFENQNGRLANGEWGVKNNQVCFSYKDFGDTSCNFVERSGDAFQYVQTDGSKEFYITELKRGDSADLVTRFLTRK